MPRWRGKGFDFLTKDNTKLKLNQHLEFVRSRHNNVDRLTLHVIGCYILVVIYIFIIQSSS